MSRSSERAGENYHQRPEMGFVDRRRFSLRTIVDRVIFLFSQENISKEFQNAFIRRLEEALLFETLVLKTNRSFDDGKRSVFVSTHFLRSVERFEGEAMFHGFCC